MLVTLSHLVDTPILSMEASAKVAYIRSAIVDPDSLKIVAFRLYGPLVNGSADILVASSIREYSRYGCVIDTIDELVEEDDVIKIKKILELNFDLLGLKVETKKKTNLGKISDYAVTTDNFSVQQIIVKRPLLKGLFDPELIISRREIVEVTDYKVIVKDEEKVLKEKAVQENFIPNFVNPFRKNEQDLAPADTKTPADTNTE